MEVPYRDTQYPYKLHFLFGRAGPARVRFLFQASTTAIDETRVLIRRKGQSVEFTVVGRTNSRTGREERRFSADGARRSESHYHGTDNVPNNCYQSRHVSRALPSIE